MADPIVIQLQARGIQELVASFKSVEQTIIGFERSIGAAGERGARARVSLAQRENADKTKEYAKAAKEIEKWQRQGVADAEKSAKAKTKIAERSAADEVRAVEKAEREKQRAADQTAAYLQRVRNRSAEMAGRDAVREVDRRIAEEKRVYDARVQFARSIGGNITGSIAGAARGIVSAGRGLVSGALQVGGGFGIADSVQREVKLTGMAGTLAASSQADPNGKKWKTAEVLAGARSTGRALSMDPEEVIRGIGQFKDLTGDLGRGMRMAPGLAKVATALGADTGELMKNAGNIAMSSPKMSDGDIMKLVRVQAAQGMVGAVELKDMAQHGARLTAGASLFGGDRSTNIATMGAFAQIARQHGGAASPAEATLAAQRFATDVAKHHKGIEAAGIKVSDGKGGLRDANAIVKDMLTKSGGDVLKFGQFGLGERGNKVLTGFADIYKQGGGGTAGMEAVNKELGKFTAGVSDEDIDAKAKERLADADKQVEKAMMDLKDAVGTQLLPEFMKLVEPMKQLTPMIASVLGQMARLAEAIAHNPIKGIGAIIAAKCVLDIGSAAIGNAIKDVLVRIIAGAAPGAAGGTAGSAAGGVATKALALAGGGSAAAGGAVVAGGIVQGALVGKFGLETGNAVITGQEQGQNIAAMLRSSDPSKRAEGEKLLSEAKRKAGGAGAGAAAGTERSGTLLNALVNPLAAVANLGVDAAIGAAGGKSNGDRSLETIQAKETVSTVELVAALKANTAATTANTSKTTPSAGTPESAGSPTRTLPMSARP